METIDPKRPKGYQKRSQIHEQNVKRCKNGSQIWSVSGTLPSQIWKISVSGQVLAQGWRKHEFCINSRIAFRTNFPLKSRKMDTKNTSTNQCNKNMGFVCQRFPKRCRNGTENQWVFWKNPVGCFCRNHRFIIVKAWFVRNLGSNIPYKSIESTCGNWVWKRCAEFSKKGCEIEWKWEP